VKDGGARCGVTILLPESWAVPPLRHDHVSACAEPAIVVVREPGRGLERRRSGSPGRAARPFAWGLIPDWSQDLTGGAFGRICPLSWTETVASLASVVEAKGARLVAVGEPQHVIGVLGVALLVQETSDVETPPPSARFADEHKVVRR